MMWPNQFVSLLLSSTHTLCGVDACQPVPKCFQAVGPDTAIVVEPLCDQATTCIRGAPATACRVSEQAGPHLTPDSCLAEMSSKRVLIALASRFTTAPSTPTHSHHKLTNRVTPLQICFSALQRATSQRCHAQAHWYCRSAHKTTAFPHAHLACCIALLCFAPGTGLDVATQVLSMDYVGPSLAIRVAGMTPRQVYDSLLANSPGAAAAVATKPAATTAADTTSAGAVAPTAAAGGGAGGGAGASTGSDKARAADAAGDTTTTDTAKADSKSSSS